MHILELGTLPLTILATVALAVFLLALRVYFVQRIQHRRHRENRQQTERLRSLVTAYRSLAGSFTRPGEKDWRQIEEALAEIVLFGSLQQVSLAAGYAALFAKDEPADYQELVVLLRNDLREQLGLEALPPELDIPRSGPGRPPRLFQNAQNARN